MNLDSIKWFCFKIRDLESSTKQSQICNHFDVCQSKNRSNDYDPVFGGPKISKQHQIQSLLHRDTQIPEENLKSAIDLYDEVNGSLDSTSTEASESHL